MKKCLALILVAVQAFVLVACGGDGGVGEINTPDKSSGGNGDAISTDTPGGSGDEAEESKGTELTIDNYAQYINLDIKASAGDPLFTCPDGVRISESYMATMLYGSVFVNMTVSGASTNFNYNDVTIKVKATVTYRTDTYKNYFADIMESKETQEFDLEAKTNISGNCDVIVAYYELPEGYYTHDYLISVDYEMVEVTGTVTPA